MENKKEKRGGHNRRAITWNGTNYPSLRALTDSLGLQKGHLSWYIRNGKPFRRHVVDYVEKTQIFTFEIRIEATRQDIPVTFSDKYNIKAETDRKAWAEARKKILSGRKGKYKTRVVSCKILKGR